MKDPSRARVARVETGMLKNIPHPQEGIYIRRIKPPRGSFGFEFRLFAIYNNIVYIYLVYYRRIRL
jgi:hypothetical protein